MNEARILKEGGVGIIPTDTLYGIVAAAPSEVAVMRVYELKQRAPTKPCIILISSLEDLALFGIRLSEARRKVLSQYWPGPVSIIFSCGKNVPEYLHRGTCTLAFRLPNDAGLIALLRESGPLIAPSANPEDLPPATTVEEAKKYFGSNVDFYTDAGEKIGAPSTIIALDEQGNITMIREGGFLIQTKAE